MKKHLSIMTFYLVSTTVCALDLKEIEGVWSMDCEEVPDMMYHEDGKITFTVFSSQAYLALGSKRLNANWQLYFNNVEDVGRGGMNYKWSSISKAKPVATISELTKKSYKLSFQGLIDDQGKEVASPHNVKLGKGYRFIKCDF